MQRSANQATFRHPFTCAVPVSLEKGCVRNSFVPQRRLRSAGRQPSNSKPSSSDTRKVIVRELLGGRFAGSAIGSCPVTRIRTVSPPPNASGVDHVQGAP